MRSLFDRILNKIYYLRYRGSRKYFPNLRYIEIELTSGCSLRCLNCDRCCSQAPRNEIISLKQIKYFIDESNNLQWPWHQIKLIGGEPTLHPQFWQIIEMFRIYKIKHPATSFALSTNGFSLKTKEIIQDIPSWIYVYNSEKQGSVHMFHPFNIAPLDLEGFSNANFSEGCPITNGCGIGLNRYGYYPCGSSAAIDRVFGFNIGYKHLSEVNLRTMTSSLVQLCRYCGHFKHYRDYISTKKQLYSSSWVHALKGYRKALDKMTLYGN
jgi:hypothetical protein